MTRRTLRRTLRRALPALLVLGIAAAAAVPAARAQSAARVDVTGVVTDSTDTGLGGATVVLLGAADSVLVAFNVTDNEGAFRVRRVAPGDYVLQITFVGFAPYTAPLAVTDAPVDAGRIVLREAVGELGELVISAERVPMVVKKDTLEYNAAAFAVRPGSNVEELLKRLPGMEVERDGTIKAQGETVDRVLVDGKEFFGNDPTIATRNLPADAVDRVQVYDKKSDLAEFTGVDDGEESKTINLSLKEDRKTGYFGNVEGGFGGAPVVDGGARYDGKLNVNRFSGSSQLSVIANLNNVGRQGFGVSEYISFMGGIQSLMREGGGLSFGGGGVPVSNSLSDGFSVTRSGGLNVNHAFTPRTSLRSSLFVNRIDNEQDRRVLQQQLFGATISSLAEQEATQVTQAASLRLNTNLDHEFAEGHDLRFRGSFSASDGALASLSRRTTTSLDGALENESATDYDSDTGALDGDANLTWRKRLGGGRSLVAEARADVRDGDLTGTLDALNTFYDAGDVLTAEELAQLQEQATGTFTHGQKLAYTEPLGDRRFLQVAVEHRAVREDQDRSVFDVTDGVRRRNDGLSSSFERAYRYGKAGFDLRSNGERLALSAGLDLQRAQLDGTVRETVAPGEAPSEIGRSYVHLLPSASLRYDFDQGRNLDLRYNATTREPSLRDLQPVVDNSDPLNLYVGNPGLRPEVTHAVTARYLLFDQFTFTNLFVSARGAYTADKIARARTVDERLRQTVTPVNADGDWTLSANVSFGTPVRRLGTSVRLSANSLLNRGVEFINGDENTSRILRNTIGLELENRDKEVVDARIGARFTFNDVAYSLNERLDQRYLNRTFFADLTYHLGDAWRFATEFDVTLYSKEVFGDAQNVPLWEAEIARSFMNDQAEVRLVAQDLLNQNVGLSYTNTNAYIQEERIQGLGRYLMLKFVYTLSSGAPRPQPGMRVEIRD